MYVSIAHAHMGTSEALQYAHQTDGKQHEVYFSADSLSPKSVFKAVFFLGFFSEFCFVEYRGGLYDD